MRSITLLQRATLVALSVLVLDFNICVGQVSPGQSFGIGDGSYEKSSLNPLVGTPYIVELLPGESFSGTWFYYSWTGGSLTASLVESPSVSWLSLSPTSFSSTSCDDIKHVTYQFTAPSTPGTYTTTIMDLNESWGNVDVTLHVTNNPSIGESLVVQANLGEDKTVDFDRQRWPGFGPWSCVENFTPGQSIDAVLKTIPPSSDWFELNPTNYTVAFGDTVYVVADFHATEPGTLTALVFEKKQFHAWPKYYHVELHTGNTVVWRNASGGAFADTLNWIGERVPDMDQTALFDEAYYEPVQAATGATNKMPVTVTFDDLSTTAGLNIRTSQVIFDLQAHSYGVTRLSVGSNSINTPDESQLEITNGALGVNLEAGAIFIGGGEFRGQLSVSTGGIFEIDTDDPAGLFAVGAADCGGGECGRLIIQNGGVVFTNSSGKGSTRIGHLGGEGSVFISGLSKWQDQSMVYVGSEGGTGLLDLDSGTFRGKNLQIATGSGSTGNVILRRSGFHVEALEVGGQGVGELNSENSLVIIGSTFIVGKIFQGQGTVILGDSTLAATKNMILGQSGVGLLTIWGRGDLSSFGEVILGEQMFSDGKALVHGAGSRWFVEGDITIGSDGDGHLEVVDGARFEAQGDVKLGLGDESVADIEVSGSGTRFVSRKATVVGLMGNAEFSVSDSSVVRLDSHCIIGGAAVGIGEMTVASKSFVSISDTLFVGLLGSGGLSVLSGGSVLAISVFVGEAPNSIGSILVDSDSTRLDVIQTLRLGNFGTGFARVTGNGIIDADVIQIGPLGSIDASGGTLIIGGLVQPSPSSGTRQAFSRRSQYWSDSVSSSGATNGTVRTNSLMLSAGAVVLADTVIFEEGGYLGGEGSFSFDVTNSGGINPGDSLDTPGILTVDANYTQLSNGTLFIELEGDIPGSGYDQLVVNGDAAISGTLDVSVLNDFEPLVGQTFEILIASNITGTFDEVVTHSGLGVDVIYNAGNIVATVTSEVAGVDDEETIIPTAYSLEQNYPNPFNPWTTISFDLPKETAVSLHVFDLSGRLVKVLSAGKVYPNGRHHAVWNGRDDRGRPVATGMYFYRLEAGSFRETKRMSLVK